MSSGERATVGEGAGPRPLEIAFLTSWLQDPARGTGTAVGISGLAQGLRALGHRAEAVLPRRRLPTLTLTRLAYNAGLPRRLRRRRADLLVGFDFDGCFLARSFRSRLVVALKGILADEARFETGATRLAFLLLARLEGWNARRAGRVAVTSRYCRDVASGAYGVDPGKIEVVPEGIDLGPWDRLAAAPPPRRSPRPTILSVARQYRRKNTLALLEALPAVRRAYPAVRLRVVGGGPQLESLRRTADRLGLAGAVELLGQLPEEEVRRQYLTADLFCLPSLQEGFGIVFLEAMAAGLPIVAHAAAAVPEVVPDGKAGLLTPAGDRAALVAALLRLLGDPALRRRLGAEGRRRVRRYAWPEVEGRFLTTCAPALDAPGIGPREGR